MADSDRTELLLWIARRTLGISLVLYVFYLIAPSVWPVPPLTGQDTVAIMAVVFLGVLLGVAFSTVWPVPAEKGLPRVLRTAVLSLPALGIGMAVQVTIEGAESSRAYFVMFALAAWLGSTWLVASPPAEDEEEDDDLPVDDGHADDAAPAEA